MAEKELTPVHEVRPTTQELPIPARFIPTPTVEPAHTFASVTDHISSIVRRKKMPPTWWLLFAIGSVGLGILTIAVGMLVFVGIGLWGLNQPVNWGFALLHFLS